MFEGNIENVDRMNETFVFWYLHTNFCVKTEKVTNILSALVFDIDNEKYVVIVFTNMLSALVFDIDNEKICDDRFYKHVFYISF